MPTRFVQCPFCKAQVPLVVGATIIKVKGTIMLKCTKCGR